ncbi:DUF4245 domain-containing protein [Rhodoluna sp.]|uniref:DUF4245 domain-containing protein n=1 Tax=Rhodoluna sp. TaxID=1969481 RepID=UPI0025E68482|nr:DUF4245 domain-containing protein [Rhodoluna sp.]
MAEDDAAAKRRARQTVINLLLSLGASLGIVLALVLIVPRDDSNRIQPVDFRSVAAEAQSASGNYIVAPELPQGWWANSARYLGNPADGVATFYAGFVGPKNQYIGLTQAQNPNPTWLVQQLQGAVQTGTFSSGYRDWTIYESPEVHNPKKTKDYIMVMNFTEGEKVAVIIYGTASADDFAQFATNIDLLLKNNLNGAN